jgi:hypothetical protein
MSCWRGSETSPSPVSIQEAGQRRLCIQRLPCLRCHELASPQPTAIARTLFGPISSWPISLPASRLGSDEGGVRDMMLPSLGGPEGIGLWATAPHRSPTSPQDAINGPPIGDGTVRAVCRGFPRLQPTAPSWGNSTCRFTRNTNHAAVGLSNANRSGRSSWPRHHGS